MMLSECEDAWPRWAKWSYEWTGFHMYGRTDHPDDEEAEGYWETWRRGYGVEGSVGDQLPWQAYPTYFADPSTWCSAPAAPDCFLPVDERVSKLVLAARRRAQIKA